MTSVSRRAALVLALGGLPVLSVSSPAQGRFVAEADLAIVGVDVLTMEAGECLVDQTLLVEGTRITALGSRARVVVPAAARVVEGGGRFLMPGLVDAHVHLRRAESDALVGYLQAGITTVRDMNGRPFILDWRDWIEAGEFVGPRLRVASPTLGNWSSPKAGYTTPQTRAAGVDVVRRFLPVGYDWIKVYSFLPPEGFRGVLEVANSRGVPVGGHVPVGTGLAEALDLGLRSIEHLTEYVGSALTPEQRTLDQEDYRSVFGAGEVDWEVMDALIEATVAARAWNVPTLVWFDRFLPAPVAEQAWSDPGLRAQAARNRREIVRRLHAAGAPMAVGTDSDAGGHLAADAIHDEIAAMVQAGLEVGEVLSLATVGGAGLLGLAGEQGRVKAGQRADLLLLRCDPREDLSCLRAPELVVAAGRVVVDRAGSPAP